MGTTATGHLPVPALTAPYAAPREVRYLRDGEGRTVGSVDRRAWLAARRHGVTATDACRLVTRDGAPSRQRAALLAAKITGDEGPRLRVFEHGIRREPVIAAWVAQRFGIRHNTLLCVGASPRHLATPDGVGDHSIAEIKTSLDPLERVVATYRDQLQWQLHVTGCDRVLLVVEHRESMRRDFRWVGRDERRIGLLVRHADLFLADLDARRLDAARAGHPAPGDPEEGRAERATA